jgi:hypothetical protein
MWNIYQYNSPLLYYFKEDSFPVFSFKIYFVTNLCSKSNNKFSYDTYGND